MRFCQFIGRMVISYLFLVLLVLAGSSAMLEKQLQMDDHLGMNQDNPAESCKGIYRRNYGSHNNSGYYWIKPNEETLKV